MQCKSSASNSLVSELVSGSVEAVTEEKARKVLERVDFLTKLREEVVVREDLAEVLEEHAQLALDLPEWWQPGKHDHDLVIGAARCAERMKVKMWQKIRPAEKCALL